MSKIWPHFTKENPCPACGGHDWCCRAGEKKFICMRIQSSHANKDGGFYHEYGGKKPAYIPLKRSAPKVVMDFERYQKELRFGIVGIPKYAIKFCDELGVSTKSMDYLLLGRSHELQCWSIPMRDGDNKIIGIHLRCDDGSKKAVVGSRNGLFIPQIEPQKIAYICEGASNTAALLTMGFYAIGRPSCNSGAEMLKVAIKRLGVRNIVIVADNDPLKFRQANDNYIVCGKNGLANAFFRPGQDGAIKLKKELGLKSVIFTTPSPCKDVRELLQKLGVESARNYIQSSVNSKVWTKV